MKTGRFRAGTPSVVYVCTASWTTMEKSIAAQPACCCMMTTNRPWARSGSTTTTSGCLRNVYPKGCAWMSCKKCRNATIVKPTKAAAGRRRTSRSESTHSTALRTLTKGRWPMDESASRMSAQAYYDRLVQASLDGTMPSMNGDGVCLYNFVDEDGKVHHCAAGL